MTSISDLDIEIRERMSPEELAAEMEAYCAGYDEHMRLVEIRDRLGLEILGIEDTPLWEEVSKLEEGEPWTETAIAGLQYYDYAQPGLSGEPISPALGDRLVLVRAPADEADTNAIEIWWRNDVRLGHVPRKLAAEVAPLLDAGASCRAYVASAGNGEAWSAWALLIGEAVRLAHARHVAEYRPPPRPVFFSDLDDDIPF